MNPTIIEGWTTQHEACRRQLAEYRRKCAALEQVNSQLHEQLSRGRRQRLLQAAYINDLQRKYNQLLEEVSERVR